jgi:hypothetical protein
MAYSGAGQGGFNPSMPSTHHDHIIVLWGLHRTIDLGFFSGPH